MIRKEIYTKISIYDVLNCCETIVNEIGEAKFNPDSVIFMLRGGMVPARFIIDGMDKNIPLYAIDVKYYDDINSKKENAIINHFDESVNLDGKSILLVDDIWDNGESIKVTKRYLEALYGNIKVYTATLYVKKSMSNVGKPDFCGDEIGGGWLVFPWEEKEFEKEFS